MAHPGSLGLIGNVCLRQEENRITRLLHLFMFHTKGRLTSWKVQGTGLVGVYKGQVGFLSKVTVVARRGQQSIVDDCLSAVV